MTESDAELRRKAAHQRKMIALCEKRGHDWTANHYRAALAYTERLLAMPRKDRPKYEPGTL